MSIRKPSETKKQELVISLLKQGATRKEIKSKCGFKSFNGVYCIIRRICKRYEVETLFELGFNIAMKENKKSATVKSYY